MVVGAALESGEREFEVKRACFLAFLSYFSAGQNVFYFIRYPPVFIEFAPVFQLLLCIATISGYLAVDTMGRNLRLGKVQAHEVAIFTKNFRIFLWILGFATALALILMMRSVIPVYPDEFFLIDPFVRKSPLILLGAILDLVWWQSNLFPVWEAQQKESLLWRTPDAAPSPGSMSPQLRTSLILSIVFPFVFIPVACLFGCTVAIALAEAYCGFDDHC